MDIIVIEFSGDIDDFPSLVQTIDNRIRDGDTHLVVDLHSLPFINSAALGFLIRAQKNVEEEGGELALARVQPAITRILEMAHLDAILPAFKTVEEAVVYLGGDPSLPAESAPRVRTEKWKPKA
jgi:anti-anti-sigma factor